MSSLACLFLPICFGLLLNPGLRTNLLMSSSWNISFALTATVDHFIISSLGTPCSKRTFRYNNVTKQLPRNEEKKKAKPCPGDCFTLFSVDVYIFPVLDLGSYLFTCASCSFFMGGSAAHSVM